ncbi:MAG: hypothetical protein N4A35_09635 [Flavobacteriales bacterium]|nr:hypothetical protein [Flavobacteriales bacterium]
MMSSKAYFIVFILFIICSFKVEGQIAIAVAKDNWQTMSYRVEANSNAQESAAKFLRAYYPEEEGYEIRVLDGGRRCGHRLKKGYYVVIRTSNVIWKKLIVYYALGASSKSYEKAAQKALKHLKMINKTWSLANDSYTIVEKRKFRTVFD